jgi:signal transduction histidine kinase
VRGYLHDLGELYSVKAELTVTGSEDNLSPAMRRAVYRIVREAASNAARHGGGSQVSVGMVLNPQQTIIEIEDNGCGFEPPPPAMLVHRPGSGTRSGLGLLNMHQLARSFSGVLEIRSTPGQGTKIVVRMPEHSAGEGGAVEVAVSR